jgi:hypothetical protein
MITVLMDLEKGKEQQESAIVILTSCEGPSFVIQGLL